MRQLGITRFGPWKPFDMLVPRAAKIRNALTAKKRKVALNTRSHCTTAELAEFLAVLLAVEDCLFERGRVPFL